MSRGSACYGRIQGTSLNNPMGQEVLGKIAKQVSDPAPLFHVGYRSTLGALVPQRVDAFAEDGGRLILIHRTYATAGRQWAFDGMEPVTASTLPSPHDGPFGRDLYWMFEHHFGIGAALIAFQSATFTRT